MSLEINYIIVCGRRCTSDQFLEKYKLKRFSSPFSSIFCDFETAIVNINNKFENFLKVKYINNHTYKQIDHWRMAKEFFYNYDIIKKFEKNINDMERLLIWTHFNPIKDNELIKRRIKRICDIINNNNNNNILLFYIDKIRNYLECEKIKNNILNIIKKYNIKQNILYIIPCQDLNNNIKLYFSENKIKIFLLKVTQLNELLNLTIKENKFQKNGRPILDGDIDDKNNRYDLLYKKICEIYKFNLFNK